VDTRQLDRWRSGVTASHRGLEAMLTEAGSSLDTGAPSLLPDWSIGHVLTHLARNADSMTWVLESSQRGELVDRYPGGGERRGGDIDAGAGRPAAEQVADVVASNGRLDAAIAAHTNWAGESREIGGRVIPVGELLFLRWREVEVHRADLGLGYGPEDWPREYVRTEIGELTMAWNARRPMGLTGLPREALEAPEPQRLAWLLGRADIPGLSPAGVFGPPPRPHSSSL
jgi:maleylpyruvate isomerase